MADDELIADDERDKFAGTSAMSGATDGVSERTTSRHDVDGDDRLEGARSAADDDYQRGRHDEAVEENNRPARFDRDRSDERTDSPQRF
jgi:hypothetical protein